MSETTFLDSLFAVTAPAQETIKVWFPGHMLEFRVVTDHSETLKIRRLSQSFVAEFDSLKKQKDWRPFAKTDVEVLAISSYFAQTLIGVYLVEFPEPDDQAQETDGGPGSPPAEAKPILTPQTLLTEFSFVKMAKERGNTFDKIRDEINAGQFAVVEVAFDKAVGEAKKD